MSPRASNRLAGALVGLLLAGTAAAQDEPVRVPHPDEVNQAEYERLARSRNREAMRFGENPLVSAGIEQGDNGFRESTPSLGRHTGTVAIVDREELRARTLALFDEGARFDRPPTVRGLTRNPSWPSPAPREDAAPAPAAEPLEPGGGWGWGLPLAAFVVLLGFVLKRSGFPSLHRD